MGEADGQCHQETLGVIIMHESVFNMQLVSVATCSVQATSERMKLAGRQAEKQVEEALSQPVTELVS